MADIKEVEYNRNFYDEDIGVTEQVQTVKAEVVSNKVNYHRTNTSGFNSLDYSMISPEEAQEQWLIEKQNVRFANEDFELLVNNWEAQNKREITYQEFSALCYEYARHVCEEEIRRKNGLYGPEEPINPITHQRYFKMLLENKPLSTAFRESMSQYEETLVAPISDLLEEQMKRAPEVVTVDLDDLQRINLRHRGKVRIIGVDHGNKYVQINNEEDVKLLLMKHRQDYLDKKYPTIVQDGKVIEGSSREDREFE
jgi:hypothetical protein